MIILFLLFFCSLEATETLESNLRAAALGDIPTIKRTYTEPGAADYIIGLKFIDLNPTAAFKQFLKASVHPGVFSKLAREQITKMLIQQVLSQENLKKILIDDQAVTNLLEETKKLNRHAFIMLNILREKLPPAVSSEVQQLVVDLFNNTHNLTYDLVKDIVQSNVPLTLGILENLEKNYHIASAAFQLGTIYDWGLYTFKENVPVAKDMAIAFKHYKIAADAGIPQAQYAVGKAYLFKAGTEDNAPLALEYFNKAIAQNYTPAMTFLGSAYYYGGLGLESNKGKTAELMKQAAALKDPEALYNLGQLAFLGFDENGTRIDPDYEKALRYFEKARHAGFLNSNYYLGFFYKTGLHVPKDRKRADELYRELINSKDPQSYALQGQLYEEGLGVTQDLTKAKELYENSIHHGNFFAESKLKKLTAKIAEAAKNLPVIETPEDQFEIPEVQKIQRQPQKPTSEQVEYGRRKSAEKDFLDELNKKFACTDGSIVSEVNFQDGYVKVFRALDKTEALVTIDTEQKKRFKRVKKFVYQKRVSDWFDDLAHKNLTGSEYNSMIRHAFPEMVDYVCQLFGEKLSDGNYGTTLTIEGSLIPGKYPKNSIVGNFVYGYNNNKKELDLYHRFLHLEKPKALA